MNPNLRAHLGLSRRRSSDPYCSTDRRGSCAVPGSADAVGSCQVPIAAQTTVGLVRCHRSSGPHCNMDHRGSIARCPRFSRFHRSSGPHCSTNHWALVSGGPTWNASARLFYDLQQSLQKFERGMELVRSTSMRLSTSCVWL